MRRWRVRLMAGVLASLCLAALFASPTAAQRVTRPSVTWNHSAAIDCTSMPNAPIRTPVVRERPNITVICADLPPGGRVIEAVTVTSNQDVIRPRLSTNTANGEVVVSMCDNDYDGTNECRRPSLPDPIVAGEAFAFKMVFEVPPGFRAKRVSARVTVTDRNGVLYAPLNARVNVRHPTPEEIARTPVIVPSNHIQLVKLPPSAGPSASTTRTPVSQTNPVAARFNIRHLIVRSGTNVTWTNKARLDSTDTSETDRAVKGTLCNPSVPIPRRDSPCTFHPDAVDECSTLTAGVAEDVRRDLDGRILCFISPQLVVGGYYALTIERPDRRQPLTYYMEDALHTSPSPAMVESFGNFRYYPYLTVK